MERSSEEGKPTHHPIEKGIEGGKVPHVRNEKKKKGTSAKGKGERKIIKTGGGRPAGPAPSEYRKFESPRGESRKNFDSWRKRVKKGCGGMRNPKKKGWKTDHEFTSDKDRGDNCWEKTDTCKRGEVEKAAQAAERKEGWAIKKTVSQLGNPAPRDQICQARGKTAAVLRREGTIGVTVELLSRLD